MFISWNAGTNTEVSAHETVNGAGVLIVEINNGYEEILDWDLHNFEIKLHLIVFLQDGVLALRVNEFFVELLLDHGERRAMAAVGSYSVTLLGWCGSHKGFERKSHL